MGKLKHYFEEGFIYFLTTTVFAYRPYFARPENAEMVIQILYNLRKRKAMYLLEFVVMPEHLHLLLMSGEKSIPFIMQELKKGSARLINKAENQEGRKVWIEGYYDHQIRDVKDYETKVEYIFQNPVKRNLVNPA